MNSRELALELIRRTLDDKTEIGFSVECFRRDSSISPRDLSLASEIAHGVVRHLLKLDWIIDRLLRRPNRVKGDIRNILRIGIYQMEFMDAIPDYAAINETVSLVRRVERGRTKSRLASALVNGVLREYQRRQGEIDFPDPAHDPIRHISVTQSHPLWLVRRWVKNWGQEWTRELCESNNRVPRPTLRVNTLRCSREELIAELTDLEVHCSPGVAAPEAIRLGAISELSRIDLTGDPRFSVQDEASMLVGHMVAPREGDLVVDVCSAPGGKTTHIAELMRDSGKIIALDISDRRLKMVDENCQRLQLKSVETRQADATQPIPELVGRADRVLVDAPCSNTGVIRQKPDVKWLKTEADIEELSRLQRRMLASSAAYVKPGGMLIYCTCSIEPEENEEVVRDFLESNRDFVVEPADRYLPESAAKFVDDHGMFRSFPHVHDMDGFFCAALRRRLECPENTP